MFFKTLYRQHFYKSWFNIVDGFIIVVSLLVNVLLAVLDNDESSRIGS